MNFLFVNNQELFALMELPWMQRVIYLMGIRPYMDKDTCLVGIKRKISYQSLREILYIAPIAGVKTDNPSQSQVRRAVKSLERAGLIALESSEKHLILKCILAAGDRSCQNKADMRPTPQADTRPIILNDLKSIDYEVTHRKADRDKMSQADMPHKSEINIIFLSKKFEKFWSTYPQPKNKSKAWEAFQNLNPDDDLFVCMMNALNAQIKHYNDQQLAGHWVPNWKYPVNWILQHSWKDEINNKTEKKNANHQRYSTKKSPIDILWESCKDGADYRFPEEISQSDTKCSNVIAFPGHVKHR